MKKQFLVAGGLAIAAVSVAVAGPERIEYPADYKTKFENYHNGERKNGKQLASFYANDVAINGVKKDGKFPDGSVVIMEVYKAKADKDGTPVRKGGKLIQGDLAAVMVKMKGDGWGKDYSGEKMDVGDWEFAGFKGDGSRLDKNFADCRSCHSELKNSEYMFSYENFPK